MKENSLTFTKLNIKKGILDEKDFPLLLHIDEILSEKKEVNIPWKEFTFIKEAQL